VNISVTSVATYLPSSTINDDAIFMGTTTRLAVPPTLTPIQEASLRMQQTEKQLEDAKERNIVWAVENAVDQEPGDPDADADGVEDTDYVKRPDGGYDRVNFHDCMVPVGLRNESGHIHPMDVDEAHFGGVSERVPTRLTEMVGLFLPTTPLSSIEVFIQNATKNVDIPDLDQTQPLGSLTQDLSQCLSLAPDRQASVSSNVVGEDFFGANGDVSFNSALPPSDMASSLASPLSSIPSSQGSDIDTQMLKNMVLDNEAGINDMDMLGLCLFIFHLACPC
jgi:meiosis-specific protein HOP1